MPSREQIIALLKTRSWFQNTDPKIQEQLLFLPRNCDGFLDDLSHRPEEIQGVKFIRIAEIFIPTSRPIYLITLNFLIAKNNQTNHYQIVSWKQGVTAGVKGIVIIQDPQTKLFTHLILLKTLKIGVAKTTYDCIGGFTEPNENTFFDFQRRFLIELQEELGLPKIPPYEQIIDLGNFYPDSGVMNNFPQLFAIIFSSLYFDQIVNANLPNPDLFETSQKIVIPLQNLKTFVKECPDSYVHPILTRLWTNGIDLFSNSLALSLAQ